MKKLKSQICVLAIAGVLSGPLRTQESFVTFPVTDEALVFSPYNTYSDGNGDLLRNNIHAGSTYAQWTHPGSYFKTTFTGTSARLKLDASSVLEGQMPKVRWSVDNLPLFTKQLQRAADSLLLASGLKGGSHSLIFYLAATDANYDRWKTPAEAIRIQGILLDAGGSAVAPSGAVGRFPKQAVFFGDSITEGGWVNGDSNRLIEGRWVDWVAHSDATQAWPRWLAAAMDSEYGTCGFGGMSWLKPVHLFPALPDAWNFYFENHSRLVNRKLSPVPDYVFVNLGTNDGDHDTAQAAEKWLRDVRAAVDGTTPIFVIIPFGQMNRDSLNRAIANAGDSHVYKIDLGPRWAHGLDAYGHKSSVSYDGLHPDAAANGLYAALLAAAVKKAVSQ